MPLCFIEPQEAIRVVAESVGRDARRQLLGEVVHAWVDEIPEDELEGRFIPTAEPHVHLCGTCPGRPALCWWELDQTGSEAVAA